MHEHHEQSVRNVMAHFAAMPEVAGVLLGGSIAHGFARADSDVDVMILISDEEYEERYRRADLTFFSRELCTYPEGFVDGKYLRTAFLKQVADQGSEPARFAFQDARVLFSRTGMLTELVEAAARYPTEGKVERVRRFRAQLDAWHWYCGEALRHGNRYLLGVSVGKLTLFGGRLILAHNETLYPYHKWFLEVLARVSEKPSTLLDLIHNLHEHPSQESVTAFYETVRDFQPWPNVETGWGNQFMLDTELAWLHARTPVDDL